MEPQVLLLDAPTTFIDPANAAIIEEIIQRLRGAGRTAILMISHELKQAQRLEDHLLFMEQLRGGPESKTPPPSPQAPLPTPFKQTGGGGARRLASPAKNHMGLGEGVRVCDPWPPPPNFLKCHSA